MFSFAEDQPSSLKRLETYRTAIISIFGDKTYLCLERLAAEVPNARWNDYRIKNSELKIIDVRTPPFGNIIASFTNDGRMYLDDRSSLPFAGPINIAELEKHLFKLKLIEIVEK